MAVQVTVLTGANVHVLSFPNSHFMRFEILRALFLSIQVIWDMMLCHWVSGS